METKYFCWKCKTKTHWANEVCPKANGETPLDQPVIPVVVKATGVDRSKRRPEPIKQAEEFIKRAAGRPRVYSDPKARKRERHREYMRGKRAAKRKEVLGDGGGPAEVKPEGK